MKKIFLIPSIFLFLLLSKFALAFHDVEVANEDVAALGGLWTQIYVYEEYCACLLYTSPSPRDSR